MGLWKKSGSTATSGADTQRLVPVRTNKTSRSAKGDNDDSSISLRSTGSMSSDGTTDFKVVNKSAATGSKSLFRRVKLPKFKRLVEMDDCNSDVNCSYQPPPAFDSCMVACNEKNSSTNFETNENNVNNSYYNNKMDVESSDIFDSNKKLTPAKRIISKLKKPQFSTPNKSEKMTSNPFSPLEKVPSVAPGGNVYEPPSMSFTLGATKTTLSESSSNTPAFDISEDNEKNDVATVDKKEVKPKTNSHIDLLDERTAYSATTNNDVTNLEGETEFRQFVFNKNFDSIDGIAVQKSEAGSNFNDFLTGKVVGLTTMLREQQSASKLMANEKSVIENNTMSAKKRLKERRAIKQQTGDDSRAPRHNITNHRDVAPPSDGFKTRRPASRTGGSVVSRQPLRRNCEQSVGSYKTLEDKLPRSIISASHAGDVSVMSNCSVGPCNISITQKSFISDSPFYQSEDEVNDVERDPFQDNIDDADWTSPAAKQVTQPALAVASSDDPFFPRAKKVDNPFEALDSQNQDPFLLLHKQHASTKKLVNKVTTSDPFAPTSEVEQGTDFFSSCRMIESDSLVEQKPKHTLTNADPFSPMPSSTMDSNGFEVTDSVDEFGFASANNAFVKKETGFEIDTEDQEVVASTVVNTSVGPDGFPLLSTPTKNTPSSMAGKRKSTKTQDSIIDSIRNSAMKSKGHDAEEGLHRPDPPSPRSARRMRKKLKSKLNADTEHVKADTAVAIDQAFSKNVFEDVTPVVEVPKEKKTSSSNASQSGSAGPFSATKAPPTGVPANAILGSMLFHENNNKDKTKSSSEKSKKVVEYDDNDDDDGDDDEANLGNLPPDIETDGTQSTVSSVTEEASSFYQKNFLWNKQAHSALTNYHQNKPGDYFRDTPTKRNNRSSANTYSANSNDKAMGKVKAAAHRYFHQQQMLQAQKATTAPGIVDINFNRSVIKFGSGVDNTLEKVDEEYMHTA